MDYRMPLSLSRGVVHHHQVQRPLLLVISCLLLAGCSSDPQSQCITPLPTRSKTAPETIKPASKTELEEEAYTALYHHMFAAWKGNNYHIPERFFLRFKGRDADAHWLNLFTKEGYTVAPDSRYRERTGVACHADQLQWISATEVTISGGYTYASLGAEYGTFTLQLRNGQWTVTSWKVEMIS